MSNPTPLYVPINVKAMVVNDEVRFGQSFERWELDYSSLEYFNSPMPDPFDGNTAGDWNNDPKANGVYLHWTLPSALRNGEQNIDKGAVEFPYVPNRWLVVRYSGEFSSRKADGWIIESDALGTDEGSFFIDPKSYKQTLLGKKIKLDPNQLWKETRENEELFLTAIAPGNIHFAAYQPYVENVFSIHDPLVGVKDQDTLSYFIVGWYSNPEQDILHDKEWVKGEDDPRKWMIEPLKWVLEKEQQPTTPTSLFHGIVYSLKWNKKGPAPSDNLKSTNGTIALAIGNTAIDALTSLIKSQDKEETVNAKLLQAFQYNLLQTLDQPQGEELLNQAIHKAWFQTIPGGYEWVIVQDPNLQNKTRPNSIQPQWLIDLNNQQQKYDNDCQLLKVLQQKLYNLWYAKGQFENLQPINQEAVTEGSDENINSDFFDEQLNPTENQKVNSLAYQVKQQVGKVADYLNINSKNYIPWGKTQDELAKSIQGFSKAKGIPPGYLLKRINKSKFFRANNPVVLIAGAKVGDTLTSDTPVICRTEEQLITGFVFNNQPITASSLDSKAIPFPPGDLTNVPPGVIPLFNEFFFLDPDNATLIAERSSLKTSNPNTIQDISKELASHNPSTMRGNLPSITLETWQQPWYPLFLMYDVFYYPIAYQDSSNNPNWLLQDDGKYHWIGKDVGGDTPKSPHFISIMGRTLLTPQSSFNFKRRLEEFRKKYPDLDKKDLDNLENFIQSTDRWDFLSQSLDGFMEQLAALEKDPNATPKSDLQQLIGSNNSIFPNLGPLPTYEDPSWIWPKSDFQPYRAGQFLFHRLKVIDQFGRSIDLVGDEDYKQFRPIISDDMLPDQDKTTGKLKTVLLDDPYRFIQLTPRLLQGARLNFDFVDSQDDTKLINLEPDVNPIIAWILPNHLDQSLNFYDNSGKSLGTLRVMTDSSETRALHWEDKLGGESEIPDIAHLKELLTNLKNCGESAFRDFYQAIDETLWTTDPLGNRSDQNLSVLIGRPLALIRARLKYQLNGPPLQDPSWPSLYNPQESDLMKMPYQFDIKLGEQELHNDGLIGYYLGHKYDQFNAVNTSSYKTDYIKPIKHENFIPLSFKEDNEAFVTMLVDPRAAVHATTEFLPIVQLTLPSAFQKALSAIEVSFHSGPLLSLLKQAQDQTTIFIPVPAEKNGTWSWIPSGVGDEGNSYSISPLPVEATLSYDSPALRTGLLNLSNIKE